MVDLDIRSMTACYDFPTDDPGYKMILNMLHIVESRESI